MENWVTILHFGGAIRLAPHAPLLLDAIDQEQNFRIDLRGGGHGVRLVQTPQGNLALYGVLPSARSVG